jgi:hypothetical protein
MHARILHVVQGFQSLLLYHVQYVQYTYVQISGVLATLGICLNLIYRSVASAITNGFFFMPTKIRTAYVDFLRVPNISPIISASLGGHFISFPAICALKIGYQISPQKRKFVL